MGNTKCCQAYTAHPDGELILVAKPGGGVQLPREPTGVSPKQHNPKQSVTPKSPVLAPPTPTPIEYSDGRIYKGESVNNKRNGRGRLVWPDGSQYDGEWLNDLQEGYGKKAEVDNSIYEGYWKAGLKDGRGTQITNGCKTTGVWKNGLLDGVAEEVYEDGAKFQGNFKEGKKNGVGKFVWKDGTMYEGEFKDNEFEGSGKFVWPTEEYEGGWVKSKMHGLGQYTWKDGRKFTGHYKNGHRNGYGELYDTKGGMLKATWKQGKITGRAVYIDFNGIANEIKVSGNDDSVSV